MYCPSCGTVSNEGARFCKSCGQSLTSEPVPDEDARGHMPEQASAHGESPNVPNHLVWAILTTIFCCLPFGIVSIVYAAKVNGMVAAVNIDGARQASKKAKTWAWVAFGTGLIVYVLLILIAILSNQAESSSTSSTLSTLTFSEARSQAQTIPYDELFRNNEQYNAQLFFFSGEIVQVMEHIFGDGYDFRVDVSDDLLESEIVYLADYEGPRLLEDDRIEFVAESVGLERYQAILGNAVTIPRLKAVSVRRTIKE